MGSDPVAAAQDDFGRRDTGNLLFAWIALMAIANVVGALYLTISRAESGWPWFLLMACAVCLCFATRRMMIGRALAMVAVLSALAYGVVGFVVLVLTLVT